MRDSPAKRHVQRVRAAARQPDDDVMEGTPLYQQMLLQLAHDRARLKQIQSTQAKAQLKAGLLPTYDAYLDGVLESDAGHDDQVVSTLMLWNIDAGQYWRGLELARYVLGHGLTMPDSFSRTAGCVVAEEVAVAALNALRTQIPFDVGVLARTLLLTEGQDMPDQVRAKLLLAMGRHLLLPRSGEATPHPADVPDAVDSLRRALQLHDACGGKEDLKRAERLLKSFEASPPAG